MSRKAPSARPPSADRILFISRELIAANIAYKLVCDGYDVKLFIDEPQHEDAFDGLVQKTSNWKKDLEWVGRSGLIIFDDVGYGDLQDRLRDEGYLVVGGSALGDSMELNREFGQRVFNECGIAIPAHFKTVNVSLKDGISLIQEQGGRWVIKQNSHSNDLTYVGECEDGSDAIDVLEGYFRSNARNMNLTMQRRVDGAEIAVGRFFDGHDWLGPIVMNREHKHLCAGNLGPLGGEAGTVMWYEGDETNKLFQETLAKLASKLRTSKHKGYVDINCIVSAQGTIYPLEITSRFGSSTNQLQSELQITPWGDILRSIGEGRACKFDYKSGFGLSVALTSPPYPYSNDDVNITSNGHGISFSRDLTVEDMKSVHFEDVKFDEGSGRYKIAGRSGYVLYVTGCGSSIDGARCKVYSNIKKINFPKMMYRNDIGTVFRDREMPLLEKWGLI